MFGDLIFEDLNTIFDIPVSQNYPRENTCNTSS